jgi:hypothetical protein
VTGSRVCGDEPLGSGAAELSYYHCTFNAALARPQEPGKQLRLSFVRDLLLTGILN